jgi:hypothetical protein
VKSSVVNDSPLFKTRTQRALNQQQNVLTSRYLGMGLSYNLLIPPRLNKTDSLRVVINRIRAMDESLFNRLVDYIIIQINLQDNLDNIDIKELINEIYNVRKNKGNTIINTEINNNNRTIFYNYVPTYCWFPGCYIFSILLNILASIILYLLNINTHIPSACVCPLWR